MFSNWLLVSVSIGYISLLFLIAYLGGKYRHKLVEKQHAVIYALSLGVYCTSWGFLGTSAQAAKGSFTYISVYLGPILLFVFAWPFIQRMIKTCLKLKITSIADLLSARFGKSQSLAFIVTVVALIGTLPYIALQLKAIVYSYKILQQNQDFPVWQLGLIVSTILAGFTIIFGIRTIDVTERHPGVMIAIAFESAVKLIAFLMVGIFVSFFIYDSPAEIWRLSQSHVSFSQQFESSNLINMVGLLIIVMSACLCLPRQFQVMFVEIKEQKNSNLARWWLPAYILVFAFFAGPIGLAGTLNYGQSLEPDAYVLFLPWYQQQPWLTLLTFLGAISAASSMVIISSIALSTMLSNEIVFPWLYRANKHSHSHSDYDNFRLRLLTIRKVLVLFVILLGYGVFLMASPDTLSSLGEIAFGAFAQLTPALVAAFYWRRATLTAVYGGILIGFGAWLFLNFIPQFGVYPNPFEGSLLSASSMASLLSLSVNVISMWLLSHVSRQSVQERMQASLFMEYQAPKALQLQRNKQINVQELELLVSRFVGEKKSAISFAQFQRLTVKAQMSNVAYNQKLLQHTENTLASVMGASSARLVLSSALEGRDIALDEIAVLVEEASSQRQQYSQDLLQSAIENASEGIVDSELNLVAWNKKYVDLFDYPAELIYQGSPVSDLIRYNVKRGLCGVGKVDQQVNKRLTHLRNGSPHSSEREHSDGRVIRIEGNPLPGGGFVMLFSDITAYRQAERGLIEANVDLETRVLERTRKLEQTNDALALAREKAEQAHVKKSLYLKACSHDLMQPLEAARLFTSALASQGNLTATQQRQVDNIDHSLKVANDLVADLAEIARIESGNIKPNITTFSVKSLFNDLAKEFSASAVELKVEFCVHSNSLWLRSDRSLLRRILQNLIGNAFRYASPGKVLLGARVKGALVDIQVLDNGPGIPLDKQTMVFEQFTQLDNQQSASAGGLGLGLNITQSLANLLAHPLALRSEVGMGCKFSVGVERAQAQQEVLVTKPAVNVGLSDVTVMCIDNDPDVLSGMVELLSAWGCNVLAADSYDQAIALYDDHKSDIEILLVDYQLDYDFNGIALIAQLRKLSRNYVPAILITATTDSDLEEKTLAADIGFMRKLVKPAALRAMMSAMLTKKLQEKYLQ